MNANISYRLIAIAFLLSLLSACGGKEQDLIDFERIDALCETDPHRAIRLLDSIPEEYLSEKALYRHRLLSIKANDKAFIKHTSDSLICKVIDYYYSQKGSPLYPEALYYGGRVYSDMGDLSKSLKYYQEVLDLLGNDADGDDLKVRVMSQMSQNLESLRLYNEAKTFAKKVLEIDRKYGKPQHIMADLEHLGELSMKTKNYEVSQTYFMQAKEIASNLALPDTLHHIINLAAIKYFENDVDSALARIRTVMMNMDSDDLAHNVALAYAANIYYDSGKLDTTLMYAKELIEKDANLNRRAGYKILLSDKMLNRIPMDSVLQLVKDYRDEIENHLNQNENEAALIQNSMYNYQKHLEDKINAENKSRTLTYLVEGFVALFVILTALLIINSLKRKYLSRKLHLIYYILQEIRNEADRNQKATLSDNVECTIIDHNKVKGIPYFNKKSDFRPRTNKISDLRQQIRSELESLIKDTSESNHINPRILKSQVYESLKNFIKNGVIIDDADIFWTDLENIIAENYPMYMSRMESLGGFRLNTTELHVLMLVKVGVRPGKIAKLVGRTDSAVTFSRHSIAIKIFGEKMDLSIIDNLIRML